MTQKAAFVLMVFSLLSASFVFWILLYFLNNKEEIILSIPKEVSLTLSNSFLDQAVFKRKRTLTKCIHPHIKGTVYLEMIVLPSGSNKINLLQSTMNRPGAVKCILSILEKIKFPSFKGPKIIRLYTLYFNQIQNLY